MLDFFRRQQTKLKFVWIFLIFIFSVTLVTLYIPVGDLGTATISTDVAEVGDEVVSGREFQMAYRNYLNQVRGQLNAETIRAFRFDKQVLDGLIFKHVALSEAGRLGLSVSAAEIESKILGNPIFLESGTFIGHNRYQSILTQNNMTVEEFESTLRDEALVEKVRDFVTAGVRILDGEVEQIYRLRNEKAKLDYIVLDWPLYKDQVQPTEAEENEYYEKNKASYNVGEKRKVRYAYLDFVKLRATLAASEEELRKYYATHQTEYQLPQRVHAQHILFKTQGKPEKDIDAIRAKARQVLDRAKKGENFEALAREFSEDTSAAAGGELGFFMKGQMVPEFEQAAFNMGNGAVSDLVTTQFGIHIIKVIENQVARSRPFEEIKEAVRPVVLHRKAEEQAGEIAQQISVDLAATRNIEQVAKKYGAEVRETAPFERDKAPADISSSEELLKKVFDLKQDEIGTAVRLSGGYAVPVVTEIQPVHQASLLEARAQVREAVITEKAKEILKQKVQQLNELAKTARDIQSLAKSIGAPVKTSDLLTRGGFISEYGSTTDIDKQIYSLPIGKLGTPNTAADKTIVFSVKERQEINPEEMKKTFESVRAEALNQRRGQAFQAWVNEVKKKMETDGDITINEAILQQLAQMIG